MRKISNCEKRFCVLRSDVRKGGPRLRFWSELSEKCNKWDVVTSTKPRPFDHSSFRRGKEEPNIYHFQTGTVFTFATSSKF